MPRVTDEHRAARREQILRAAWRCVAREGFHRSTMAHVIAESGLSAGAVYGYFKSKDELLNAIAERSIARIDEVFHEMLAGDAAPDPADVLETVLDRLMALAENPDGDFTLIAVQAWGEAARGGPFRDLLEPQFKEIRGHWIEVARRWQAAGRLGEDAEPEQVGRVLLGLMPGFVLQRLMLGGVTAPGYTNGLRALMSPSTRAGAAG
ncbi:MAG: TetR/AcrR family transcriptional regulator [Nocardioidaceae bacterium]